MNYPFCIYGAGIVATSVYAAIKTLYHKTPVFFLVSDLKKGEQTFDVPPTEIDGITVKCLSEWRQELASIQEKVVPSTYFIATPEVYHESIMKSLQLLTSFYTESVIKEPQIILCTNDIENKLMEAYYRSLSAERQLFGSCTTVQNLLEENGGMQAEKFQNDLREVQVYQVKSHIDKPMSGQNEVRVVNLPSYLIPIQAGASLTDYRIADLKDNIGDNISEKNRNYCELTATYYAWKNSHAKYKGICHYRRIFDIDDRQMQALLTNGKNWDVILPYPSIYYPNIAKEHTRYVKAEDWDAMIQALQETEPEYWKVYEKAVTGQERFFHNFNMLIARAEVFDEYCNFLFTVLGRTEELATPKGFERTDRFAGYLGENLTTLYFLKNRERLKILYAGKRRLI